MVTFLFFLLLYFISAYSQSLDVPTFTYNGTINTTTLSNLIKIQQNSQFVVRLSSTGTINIWKSLESIQVFLLNDVYSQILNYSNYSQIIKDFSLTQINQIGILTQSYFITKILTNQSYKYKKILPIGFTGQHIKMTDDFLIILTDQSTLLIYSQSNINSYFSYNLTNIFNQSILYSNACSKDNSSTYIAVWDGYNRIALLKCNLSSCLKVRQWSASASSIVNNVGYIEFDPMCRLMAVETDTVQNIFIWDIVNDQQYQKLFKPTQAILRTQFYDSSGQYIAILCQNNSILIYKVTGGTYAGTINLNTTLNIRTIYFPESRKFFVGTNASLVGYLPNCVSPKLLNSNNLCQDCGGCSTNFTCNPVSVTCISILLNMTSNTTSNMTSNLTSNNMTSNNMTSNNMTSNNMTSNNMTSNTIINTSIIQTYQTSISNIGNSTLNTLNEVIFEPLTQSTSYTLMFIQIIPIAIFFIGFINFWNICSLYALIDTDMPQILRHFLKQSYQATNFSAFSFFGINIDLSFGIPNSFQKTFYHEYGINSNFLDMHKQDIVKFIICCKLLLIVYLIKLAFNKINWVNKTLQIRNSYILLAQLLAHSFIFMLPIRILLQNVWEKDLHKKINILFHIFAIQISSILPFIMIIPKKIEKLSSKRQIQKNFQQKNQRQELFYNSLSMNYIAFLILLDFRILTFIGGLIIHSLGIRNARKQKKFRLNKIILSSHLFLFHLSFFLMILSQSLIQNLLVQEIFGFLCGIILIIGAVHEVCNLIFQICYSIYNYWKVKYQQSKVEDQKSDKIQNVFMESKSIAQSYVRQPKGKIKFNSQLSVSTISPLIKQYNFTYRKSIIPHKSGLVLNKIQKFSCCQNQLWQQQFQVPKKKTFITKSQTNTLSKIQKPKTIKTNNQIKRNRKGSMIRHLNFSQQSQESKRSTIYQIKFTKSNK